MIHPAPRAGDALMRYRRTLRALPARRCALLVVQARSTVLPYIDLSLACLILASLALLLRRNWSLLLGDTRATVCG